MSQSIKGYVRTCGTNHPPGTAGILYFIPCCELVGFPRLKKDMPANVPARGDKVILGEAFEYVDTIGEGYWRSVDIVLDSGGVNDDLAGETGAKAWSTGVKFRIGGNDANERELAVDLSGFCGICVIETNEMVRLVVGTKSRPAEIETIALNTGSALTDPNGGDYVIKAGGGLPALIYPPTFELNTTPNPVGG